MQKYVLGFIFNIAGDKVVLMSKKTPSQNGKLNGIGGKHEPEDDTKACVGYHGETLDGMHQAMVRESEEEIGGSVSRYWRKFAVLSGEKFQINCYSVFQNNIESLAGAEQEEIGIFDVNYIPDNVMPNVKWLIPMALSFVKGEQARFFSIKEESL
jgi:8-oxo-dGTP diphosphatase